MDAVGRFVADAVLGIDTLWGGDVMCASGTGRFIADSWFSDEPLPAAYTTAAATRVRETGGVGGKDIDKAAVEQYLREINLPAAIAGVRHHAEMLHRRCAAIISTGLAMCLETMWDLAMELVGKGDPVPYTRCVEASTGKPPEPSQPQAKRERVAELLGRAGYTCATAADLLAAVDALATRSQCAHGVGAHAGRGGHRLLRQSQRGATCCPICRRSLRRCRAPTSSSCPSRMRGSPAP